MKLIDKKDVKKYREAGHRIKSTKRKNYLIDDRVLEAVKDEISEGIVEKTAKNT